MMPSDDSEGTDIIQFGLAKKSQDVLINHMKGLANLESSIKAMVKPGANGAFSGKFLQIAEQQLMYQRDIAAGIRQLNLSATRGAGLVRQQYQKQMKDYMEFVKRVGNVLGSGSGAGPKDFGDKIWDVFKSIGGIMKGAFKSLQNAWDKSAGKIFKKTGAMGLNKLLGLGGATIIGALVGKMISSSPLLQAMFKIMNTSLTLIMRPIGDFFGAFIRPMSIYFLKEVAIPFFQSGRKWMGMGEKWGKIAVGFFINPGMAMKTAMLQAAREIPILSAGISEKAMAEADFFQGDPAAWMRAKEGLDPLPSFMAGANADIEAAKVQTVIDKIEKDAEDLETKFDKAVEKHSIDTGISKEDIIKATGITPPSVYGYPGTGWETMDKSTTPELRDLQSQLASKNKEIAAKEIERDKAARQDNTIAKGLWELFTQGPGGGGFLGETDAWDTLLFNSRSKYLRDFGQSMKDWFEDTSKIY